MSRHNPTVAYGAPFLVYIALLSLQHAIPLPTVASRTLGFVIVLAVILTVSWPYVSLRPSHPVASIALGLAVFGIWIGPDLLFGYRHFWLFENALTGRAASTLAPSLQRDTFFIVIRMLTTAALVPVLEELFWRGWLMRWLVNSKNFLKVPIGTYQPTAFWLVAGLFASEHGPYWEVGLAAGILYNWWIIRTRNLADCILAHAVTNAALGTYVLMAGQWQYWL
jgi:uncharacterized protein